MPASTIQGSPAFRRLRLRRHDDYVQVYASSRRHSSLTLSYFYRERPALCTGETARFGITTPRALGPAVVRNRIKRRLRVAARAALPLLPQGADVVLHPRPAAATLPFRALAAEVQEVFTRIAARVAAGAENTPQPRRARRTP